MTCPSPVTQVTCKSKARKEIEGMGNERQEAMEETQRQERACIQTEGQTNVVKHESLFQGEPGMARTASRRGRHRSCSLHDNKASQSTGAKKGISLSASTLTIDNRLAGSRSSNLTITALACQVWVWVCVCVCVCMHACVHITDVVSATLMIQ